MDSFVFPPEVLTLHENTSLGKNLLPLFQMKPGYVNVNNGSYGSIPRVITDALRHYENRMEQCPDGWFRYEAEAQANRVIAELRQFVRVNDSSDDGRGVGDLVFVRNATFAINSIFRSWPWERGDKLLLLSEAYGMVKLAAQFLKDSLGVDVVEIPVKFPITDDALIDLVSDALDDHGAAVKLASFSHIVSVPGVILPVSRLIDLCRSRNVASIIDGAHVLGQLELNITTLDPDFYLSNGHKWLFSAKGSAFLYIKKKWRHQIHSALITFGYGSGDPKKEFLWTGTADYSAWFTFSTALKFRSLLGERRIRDYCHRLSLDAGDLIAQIWGTEVLITDENQLASMNNIRLPLGDLKPKDTAKFVDGVIKELYMKYNAYLATFEQDGVWYARISAQIFNDISDFKMVAEAVLQIVKDLFGADALS